MFVLATCLLIAAPAIGQALTQWAPVMERVRLGVVAVRVQWPDPKTHGIHESLGTGFAIGGTPDKYYIVTAGHVIPDAVVSSDLVIEGEMRPPFVSKRGPVRLTLRAIERAQNVDLAVLTPSASPDLVTVTLGSQPRTPILGQPVAILGHPENAQSQFVDAYVAGEGPDGTIKLTGIVEAGYSGAPVFDLDGNVICVIERGDPVAEVDRSKRVMGKGVCVPVKVLFSRWQFQPFQDRTTEASALPPATKTLREDREGTNAPLVIVRTFDVTKDDHPVVLAPHTKNFREVVEAPMGFRISDARFEAWSVNHATYKIERSQEAVALLYDITSGPQFDRYRGWFKGKLVVTMAKITQK